jgi:hypothetical protein
MDEETGREVKEDDAEMLMLSTYNKAGKQHFKHYIFFI